MGQGRDSDLAPRGLPGSLLVSEEAPGFARGSVPRPACRGPHLYPKVRPEVAFDPSRRFCPGFRPEAGLPGPSPVSEGAPGSRL